MHYTIKTLATLTLLAVPAVAQTSSLPGSGTTAGTGLGNAGFKRTFAEMIAASTTTYEAAGGTTMSQTRRDEISDTLLTLTGSTLSPGAPQADGQLFFHDSLDPSAMLHFDTATSTVMFSKGVGQISGLNDTPNLPSEAVAPGKALDLVGQVDFLPGIAAEMVVEDVGGMGMGVESPDGTQMNFEKIRTVRFGRKIDGKRVMGPGSRIIVQLGEDAALQGIIRRWHEFNPTLITAAEKNTPAELNQMLFQRLRQSTTQASNVEFESSTLVLYDDGRGIMEPVIRCVFNLTIESEYMSATGQMIPKTIENPLDFYIPILRQPRASLPFIKDLQASAQATPADADEPPTSDGGTDE